MIERATKLLCKLFEFDEPIPPLPDDLTREDLWRMLYAKGRMVKPPIEVAARILLEAPDLAEMSPEQIATTIREVYRMHGLDCRCSEASIRWYMSQKNILWNIIKRV